MYWFVQLINFFFLTKVNFTSTNVDYSYQNLRTFKETWDTNLNAVNIGTEVLQFYHLIYTKVTDIVVELNMHTSNIKQAYYSKIHAPCSTKSCQLVVPIIFHFIVLLFVFCIFFFFFVFIFCGNFLLKMCAIRVTVALLILKSTILSTQR